MLDVLFVPVLTFTSFGTSTGNASSCSYDVD